MTPQLLKLQEALMRIAIVREDPSGSSRYVSACEACRLQLKTHQLYFALPVLFHLESKGCFQATLRIFNMKEGLMRPLGFVVLLGGE